MTFEPIVLPPKDNAAWTRAKQIVTALRRLGERNPTIVACIANAFAESMCNAVIPGDHDQSFGPWQLNWTYYGEPILEALKIDIRTEPNLDRHVAALLWALDRPANAQTMAQIDSATTGAEATRAFVVGFERAGAENAVERRVALAGEIEVWLSEET